MFEYEHSSKFNVSAETRELLVKEIEGEEFHLSPIQGRILLNDIEKILDSSRGKDLSAIEKEFIKAASCVPEQHIKDMFEDLREFILTDPKIPDQEKNYQKTFRLKIID